MIITSTYYYVIYLYHIGFVCDWCMIVYGNNGNSKGNKIETEKPYNVQFIGYGFETLIWLTNQTKTNLIWFNLISSLDLNDHKCMLGPNVQGRKSWGRECKTLIFTRLLPFWVNITSFSWTRQCTKRTQYTWRTQTQTATNLRKP